MTFDSLPDLAGATPCQQAPDIDLSGVDLSDMEYSVPGPFSVPITSAETHQGSAEAYYVRLRQVLAPFAAAGAVYRHAALDRARVVLVVDAELSTIALTVGDFLAAADVLRP